MPFPPGAAPDPLAIRAWNMMRGLDWAALPTVCELLGIEDIDALVHQLIVLRDHDHGGS